MGPHVCGAHPACLISLIEQGKLDVGSMVTRTMHLHEVNDAIKAMQDGEVIRSVLVGPSGGWNRLHELDVVPERVGDVHALVAVERLVADDVDAGVVEAAYQCAEIGDEQGRMRLPRRSEVLFHPEMDLQRAGARTNNLRGAAR